MLYKTCPKCGYERRPTDSAPLNQCPACGLFFDKWLKQRFRARHTQAPSSDPTEIKSTLWPRVSTLLFDYDTPQTSLVNGFRLALLLALFVWGLNFIGMDHSKLFAGYPEINNSFLHRVNLIFHEAGHIIFMPFGRFITVLGGSLGQLIMPAIVTAVFLRQRNPFAASVGLWWIGQSLMDIAPYIYDARRGQMILLGGVTGRDRPGYHDWTNILMELGWLEKDHSIAGSVDLIGALLMLLASLWGGYVLWRNRSTSHY